MRVAAGGTRHDATTERFAWKAHTAPAKVGSGRIGRACEAPRSAGLVAARAARFNIKLVAVGRTQRPQVA